MPRHSKNYYARRRQEQERRAQETYDAMMLESASRCLLSDGRSLSVSRKVMNFTADMSSFIPRGKPHVKMDRRWAAMGKVEKDNIFRRR